MNECDIAVSVRGLSKTYSIAHNEEKHTRLAEKFLARLRNPLHRPQIESFDALKDVSFDVKKGEVVGIIGRNGAGKSTLLKILSRITEPSSGEIKVFGRVGSLLEVGTGFHPELTGRENISLNGAILGMTKSEIRKQFDAIVDFSEIEKFLDTPVKRYSSGMYVRLAFAVAAHLNPEILVVDEVLAVGDSEFQKKCLGKMQDVAHQGRTILFVSHNTAAVRSLCSRAIMLKGGRLKIQGPVGDVLEEYLSSNLALTNSVELPKPHGASMWMTNARCFVNGILGTSVPMGARISITVNFESRVPIRSPRFGILITNPAGDRLLNTNNRFQLSAMYDQPVSQGSITCDLGQVPLVGGQYLLSLYLGDQEKDHHQELEALRIEVVEQDIWGTGQVPPPYASFFWWPSTFSFNRDIGRT